MIRNKGVSEEYKQRIIFTDDFQSRTILLAFCESTLVLWDRSK